MITYKWKETIAFGFFDSDWVENSPNYAKDEHHHDNIRNNLGRFFDS